MRISKSALLLLVSVLAFAQSNSRLTGTITDDSGAVVAGASVVARNTNTGQATSATSNQSGVYVISFLNPGQYELTCELAGFKKFARTGINVETGTTTTLGIELSVGSLTETVTITGAAPLLETESGAVGQLIENQNILNLPVPSRRSGLLVRLMGNVSFFAEDGNEMGPRFSIAGGRSMNQMWQLDGGVTQNMAVGVAQLSLNPPNESLQEFKVVTNNYAAEYGRTGGGVILMTTRSGTNDFHGAAYEFLRNDKLNARTFFAGQKAPLRYNIFGVSVGGPIRKNKTFFFFNYEGGRRRNGVTLTRLVPQPAEVNGDFSQRTDIRVLDPATRSGASQPAQPFPGNIIPAGRIDPIGKAFAALYPAPNQSANNPALAPSNNFRANGSDKLTQHFYTARIDHELGANDRISGRLSLVDAPEDVAGAFPTLEADERAGTRANEHKNFIVSWQHTFSPTLINEFRYMYGNRLHINRSSGTALGTNLNGKIGVNGVSGETLARVQVLGHSPIAAATHERVQTPILTNQFVNNLTIVRGNHFLKTGFEFRGSSNKDDFNQTFGGQFNFSDRPTNSALASLLLGWVDAGNLVDTDLLIARSDYYGAFLQDDWKVNSRLTLNLGFRWEMDTPRNEQNNRQSGFNGDAINPVSRTPGIITFAGMDGVSRYSHQFDKNNFQPRFGFAYRAFKTTVIRGGYGISYNGAYQGAVPFTLFQGFSLSGSFPSPDGGFTRAFAFRDGLPPITRPELDPGFGAVPVGQPVRTAPDFFAQNHKNGYSQQWNLTLQNELPGSILLEAAYLANVGHKLGGPNVSINQIPLVNGRGPTVASQTLRPFPQFGNITRLSPDWGNSSYHSMNLKLEKRYSQGFNLLTNYTWAKFIDDVESNAELGGGAGNGYQHIDLRSLNKGLSGSDIRHRLAASSVYDLPFGQGRRWAIPNKVLDLIAGGWGLGAIFEVRTGAPYGALEQTNRLNTFSDGQRPNVLRDPALDSSRPRAELVRQYFDTTAFQAPGDGIVGTGGRASGFGPGFVEFDLSVHKVFAIGERFRLTFRTDFVNLPNRPNFGQPAQLRGAGNFGTIGDITAASTAREIQFGLRLEW